jgi:predicted RNA-binding protein with PIN domain
MTIHIIIDGYNLIRQSNTLSTIDRQDIQLGREALLETLIAYQKIKRHMITVVFDGTNAPAFSQRKNRVQGITVKFSRSGELADAVIKRMVSREKEKALVVSSDLEIVNFASAKGAATIGSSEFEEKMSQSLYMEIKGVESKEESGWIPTTKKKGPSKRLPKRKRRNKTKIRKL